jgi:uncharacterized membrane protein
VSTHRKQRARTIAALHRTVRRLVWVTTPVSVALAVVALAVTHSDALFALATVSAVSGWLCLDLSRRTR